MKDDKYLFQYCQKIVVFSKDKSSVLLCRRKGEADLDGVFSFIGGKLEKTDGSIISGLKREKGEEVGESFKIKIYPSYSANRFFVKKDGNMMILPHYYALHAGGEVKLNEEYSEYKWVKLDELDSFEPKVDTVKGVVDALLKLEPAINNKDFVLI